MRKPSAIWVASLLLGSYGIYVLWIGIESGHVASLAWGIFWGALAIIGCVSLFIEKRWSQQIVYLYSLLIVASWGYGFLHAVEEELWPDDSILNSLISLLPGVVLVLICFVSSIAIFRFFSSSGDKLKGEMR